MIYKTRKTEIRTDVNTESKWNIIIQNGEDRSKYWQTETQMKNVAYIVKKT